MNKLLTLALTLAATTSLVAQHAHDHGPRNTPPAATIQLDAKIEKAVRDALPVCADTTMTVEALPYKLPARFTGAIVRTESKSHRHACETQMVSIVSPTGAHFLGAPWFIEGEEGATVEEKLRNFTYRNMQMTVTPVIERTADADGLWPVTLHDQTEAGKVPLTGRVDPQGKVYFFGSFRHGDLREARAKAFEPFFASTPAKGPAGAKVTIVEFSDFECPSCKRAAGYLDPILAKHGANVRYVRFDVPLSGHPWAFAASLAGRAIYRQKPELFWEYKKAVYNSQGELNAFMFWDWARAWAQDRDLDMTRYDADLNNPSIKEEILKGVGAAFSNDVRATPTYMVNGAVVDAGDDGAALAAYVEGLLK